jgi:hypothetical protein
MIDDLNPCEVAIAIRFPSEAIRIYKNRVIAHSYTQAIFGPYGNGNGHNDCADAFRHSFYNAINTRDTNSSVTLLFSSAHECETPEDRIIEKEMDLFNNSVGIHIGKNNSNEDNNAIAALIISELQGGRLRVLSNLNPLNDPTASTQVILSTNCN